MFESLSEKENIVKYKHYMFVYIKSDKFKYNLNWFILK